jgi:hypothetical protein
VPSAGEEAVVEGAFFPARVHTNLLIRLPWCLKQTVCTKLLYMQTWDLTRYAAAAGRDKCMCRSWHTCKYQTEANNPLCVKTTISRKPWYSVTKMHTGSKPRAHVDRLVYKTWLTVVSMLYTFLAGRSLPKRVPRTHGLQPPPAGIHPVLRTLW